MEFFLISLPCPHLSLPPPAGSECVQKTRALCQPLSSSSCCLAERNVTSPRPGSGGAAAEEVLRFCRNGTAAIIKMDIFLLRICAQRAFNSGALRFARPSPVLTHDADDGYDDGWCFWRDNPGCPKSFLLDFFFFNPLPNSLFYA